MRSGSQGVRRLDPEALKEFQWVCELAHLRYCALLVPQLGPLPELSPRETEVLAWVARGKSNPLIAEISGSLPYGRCAPAAHLSETRGLRPDQRAAVRGIGIGLIRGQS